MVTNKRVFVEGNDFILKSMFVEEGWELAPDLLSADLLCLEGGADVQPELYKEKNSHSYTSFSKDLESLGLIRAAELLDLPMVGICRGHQIIAVNEGCKLNQHIRGHNNWHDLVVDGRVYEVSSAHHQSVEHNPWLMSTAEQVYLSDDGTVEIIQWDEKILGVQFHPEYHAKRHECRDLFFNLVNNLNYGE